MPHLFDELAMIDAHVTKDPACVDLEITVEEIYSQIAKGRALRPSSVRWIHSVYESIKEMV